MTKAQELLQAMRNVVEADVAEGKYDNWVPAEKPPLGNGELGQLRKLVAQQERQLEIAKTALKSVRRDCDGMNCHCRIVDEALAAIETEATK